MKRLFFKIWTSTIFAVVLLNANAFAQSSDASNRYFEISKNLEIYSNIFKELNSFYVDPIEPGRLSKASIDAMLEELDPYTNYYTEADLEDYELYMNRKYSGIGIATRFNKNKEVVIDRVFEGGPIDKAALKPGDIIISCDGQELKGKSNEEISLLFRGAPGTKLALKAKLYATGSIVEKSIIRGEIKMPSIPHTALMGKNKDIAYVFLSQFTQNSGREIKLALDSLKNIATKLSGVIIDLRGNGGGLLTEAVNICNLFTEKNQLVVTTKGTKEKTMEYKTENAPWDKEIPLAVLINNTSASASEVVAGTIQDIDRGIIIGRRSFGKGLVQIIRPLGYNTQLKLTVSKYYTPSGRCIQAIDYSKKNEDGSVASVPDSLKKAFKTKNGRTVYDGGGIEPDITDAAKPFSSYTYNLYADGYIFDYATDYYHKNKSIASMEQFKLTDKDFEDFKSWLSKQNYNHKTNSDSAISILKETLKDEDYYNNLKAEITALETKLKKDKSTDIDRYKKEIMNLLTDEIVVRYYYQKGNIVNRLANNDEDVDEAIKYISNPELMKKVLHN